MQSRLRENKKRGWISLKVAELKSGKRQESSFLDVLFSSFRRKDLPIVDVTPYKKITKEGYLVDKHNEYQAYLKVKTNDLVSMNNSDLNRVISQLTSICRVYTEPMKILSMTYLAETTTQQLYWKGRIDTYRKMLLSGTLSKKEGERYQTMFHLAQENLRRVAWVEGNLTELTFFIVVYGKSEKEIDTRVRDMIRFGGREFDLKQLSGKKLENVVFRLNNMNTEN